MPLNTQPNFYRTGQTPIRDFSPADDFYQLLLDSHRDLSDVQSSELNAKLILLLANHIGDIDIIKIALQKAREGI